MSSSTRSSSLSTRFGLGSLRWTEVPSGGLDGSPLAAGSGAGLASGSVGAAVGSPLLELLELLLESSPGSLGDGWVGNGCWAAASAGVIVFGAGESGGVLEGAGDSGGVLGLVVSPGNGNCSAAEAGFLAAGAGGQGFAV